MDPITPVLQASPYALVLYLLGRLLIQVLAQWVEIQARKDDLETRVKALETEILMDLRVPSNRS